MSFDRRRFMLATAAALPLLRSAINPARAAGVEKLTLIEPLGQPSVVWNLFTLLRPALGEALGCTVEQQTVTGDDGVAALRALAGGSDTAPRLWGGPVMATQYLESLRPDAVKISGLAPIAKLTNGFSVALFTRAENSTLDWAALMKLSAQGPQTVSCLQQATAAYVAKLMLEKKADLQTATTLRDTLPEVVADVVDGRTLLGILPTVLIAKHLDRLRGVVSFGAARNTNLTDTPTFAELLDNRKLAFTESIGVFGPPDLSTALRDTLTAGFLNGGHSEAVAAASEQADFPVAVSDAAVLTTTMERNQRVLRRILE